MSATKLLQGLSTSGTQTVSERHRSWNGAFGGDHTAGSMYSQVFDTSEAPLISYGFGFAGDDSAVLENVTVDNKTGAVTRSEPASFGAGRVLMMDKDTNTIVLALAGRFRWRLLSGDPSLLYIVQNHTVMQGQDYFGGMMTSLRKPTWDEAAIIWMGAPEA